MDIFAGIEWPIIPNKRLSELTPQEFLDWKKYYLDLTKRAEKHPDLVAVDLSSKYGVVGIFSASQRDYFESNKIKHHWNGSRFYMTTVRENKRVLTHRDILGITKFEGADFVDHVNGHTTVVTPENLSLSDPRQNSQNKWKTKGKYSSNCFGVQKAAGGKYKAVLSIKSERVQIGTFNSEIEAAEARDLRVVQEGMNSRLNFPEKRTEYEKIALVGTIPVSKKKIRKAHPKRKLTSREVANHIEISHPKFPNGVWVDKDIFEKIKYLTLTTSGIYPVVVFEGKKIRLHRYVLGKTPKEKPLVDHINRNVWDARRKNLRFASFAENTRNQSKRKIGSSKYFGVGRETKEGKVWIASLKFEGVHVFYKRYKSEKDAALARDFFVMSDPKYSFSNLNFDWDDFSKEKTDKLRERLDNENLVFNSKISAKELRSIREENYGLAPSNLKV